MNGKSFKLSRVGYGTTTRLQKNHESREVRNFSIHLAFVFHTSRIIIDLHRIQTFPNCWFNVTGDLNIMILILVVVALQ